MLNDLIPYTCDIFFDDISVKGPYTDYGGEEAMPRIRQNVLKHAFHINRVLYNVELVNGVVSGEKSRFC